MDYSRDIAEVRFQACVHSLKFGIYSHDLITLNSQYLTVYANRVQLSHSM